MAKKKEIKHDTCTISEAIDRANTDVQDLADEMGQWRDNIEEKFGNTQKYADVSEAADTLEGLDAPDPDVEGDPDGEVKVRALGSAPSRSDRRDYAASLYAGACEALRVAASALRFEGRDFAASGGEKEAEERERLADAYDETADRCEEAQQEIENVTFPGMFG